MEKREERIRLRENRAKQKERSYGGIENREKDLKKAAEGLSSGQNRGKGKTGEDNRARNKNPKEELRKLWKIWNERRGNW